MILKAIEIAQNIEDVKSRELALGNLSSYLASAGERDKSIELAEKLENTAIAESRIIDAYIYSKDFEKAVETALKSTDIDGRSFSLYHIAVTAATMGFIDEALETAAMIEKEDRKSDALSSIVTHAIGKGAIEKALALIDNVPETYRYDDLRNIALYYYKEGNLNKAIETAQKMESLFYRADTLRLLGLEVFYKTGDIQKAEDLIDRSLAAASKIGKPAGTDGSANDSLFFPEENPSLLAIAESFAKIGRIDKATGIADSMKTPDFRTVAYTAAARAIKDQNSEEARKIACCSFEAAQMIEDEDNRLIELETILPLLAETGMADTAMEQAMHIRHPFTRSSILLGIARVLDLKKNKTAAEGLFEKAFRDMPAEENYREDLISAAILVIKESTTINKSGVFELLINEAIKADNNSPLLEEITVSMAGNNLIEQAVEKALQIDDPYYQSGALADIAEIILNGKAGRHKGKDLLETAFKKANEIEIPNHQLLCLGRIASIYVKNQEIDEALKITGYIEDRRNRSFALERIVADIIRVCAETDNTAGAL